MILPPACANLCGCRLLGFDWRFSFNVVFNSRPRIVIFRHTVSFRCPCAQVDELATLRTKRPRGILLDPFHFRTTGWAIDDAAHSTQQASLKCTSWSVWRARALAENSMKRMLKRCLLPLTST